MATTRATFAYNLRLLLDEKFKGNASSLARALKISPSLISRWVRGKSFPDSDEQIDRVAAAFGIPASELFSDSSDVDMDLRTAWRLVQADMGRRLTHS